MQPHDSTSIQQKGRPIKEPEKSRSCQEESPESKRCAASKTPKTGFLLPLKDKEIWRFWNKVEKHSTADACWAWTGSKSNTGYGKTRCRKLHCRNATIGAHRLSYFIHFGEFPSHLFVLHKCDNRICVNPDHLFLGTQLENMRDKILKGRCNTPSGNSHFTQKTPELLHRRKYGFSKLTEDQVLQIRKSHELGRSSMPALAEQFGVSVSTINGIIWRDVWRNI